VIARIKNRYLFGTGSVLVFITIIVFWRNFNSSQLIDTALTSGYLLLTMIASLALFNLRKRFSFLRIGSAVIWLQIHIYVGYMAVLLFLLHIGFRWPDGTIGIMLAVLFIIVAFSGVIGLMMSRVLPARLTARGGNVNFEQIPELCYAIKLQAEEITVNSIEMAGESTIADFYVAHLGAFFLGSRRFCLNHFVGSARHLESLIARIHAVRRYLNEDENEIMDRLESYVIEKDNLDFQYTWLWCLKAWLFVHVPFSFGLLVLGSFHGLLALQFFGG